MEYETKFGSLDQFEKGTIEIIDDDPKRYAFSNMFEVASGAKPYEKVAVGKNMEYVLEVLRAEGTSGWRTCAHDEFALVVDGEVEVREPVGDRRQHSGLVAQARQPATDLAGNEAAELVDASGVLVAAQAEFEG